MCKIAQDYDIKIVHRLKEGKYIILGRVMFVRVSIDTSDKCPVLNPGRGSLEGEGWELLSSAIFHFKLR